jgi:hypothetical protein
MFFRAIFKTLVRLYYGKFKNLTTLSQFFFRDRNFSVLMFNNLRMFKLNFIRNFYYEFLPLVEFRILILRIIYWVRGLGFKFNPVFVLSKKYFIKFLSLVFNLGPNNSVYKSYNTIFEYSYYMFLIYLYNFEKRNFEFQFYIYSILYLVMFGIFLGLPIIIVNSYDVNFLPFIKNSLSVWFWIFEVYFYGIYIFKFMLIICGCKLFLKIAFNKQKTNFKSFYNILYSNYEQKVFLKNFIEYCVKYYHPFSPPLGMAIYSKFYKDWMIFILQYMKWPFKLYNKNISKQQFLISFECRTEREFVYKFIRSSVCVNLSPFNAYLELLQYKKRLRSLTFKNFEIHTKEYSQYLKYKQFYSFMFRVSNYKHFSIPSNFISFEKYSPLELAKVGYYKPRINLAWTTKSAWIAHSFTSQNLGGFYAYNIYQYKYYRKEFLHEYNHWYGVTNHVTEHADSSNASSNGALRIFVDENFNRIFYYNSGIIFDTPYDPSTYTGNEERIF